MNLTPRQSDTLDAIRQYRQVNGIAPTMAEIADGFGVSKTTIFEHVNALEKKRVIRRDKHRSRSIEILDEPDAAPDCEIPVLATFDGKGPIAALDHRSAVGLADLFPSKAGAYALCVRGDGFHGWGVAEGDYLIIDRRDYARPGERAILEVNGVTVPTQSVRFLRSESAHRVLGVVIGVVRRAGSVGVRQ